MCQTTGDDSSAPFTFYDATQFCKLSACSLSPTKVNLCKISHSELVWLCACACACVYLLQLGDVLSHHEDWLWGEAVSHGSNVRVHPLYQSGALEIHITVRALTKKTNVNSSTYIRVKFTLYTWSWSPCKQRIIPRSWHYFTSGPGSCFRCSTCWSGFINMLSVVKYFFKYDAKRNLIPPSCRKTFSQSRL